MKLFVWDYHGVIEQGNEISVWNVTNHILDSFGYDERLLEDDVIRLYGKKWYEYFEHILPNESHERHLELQQAGCDYTQKNLTHIAKFIKPTPYVNDVIESIAKKHDQILISNTDPESLILFMKMVNIQNNFKPGTVFSSNGNTIDSKNSKSYALKKYLENKTFEDIIIIGDSPSDMTLKEVSGGKTYLYTHPWMKHKECISDYKISDLRELLKEI